MRICECDGRDAEAAAEVESGWVKGSLGCGSPEIELIATAMTSKAVEEIASDVDREAGIVVRGG